MNEIRVLDKHTAELIAAGEVIERPSSVVKELLENSIDAGAKRITCEIKSGGIELIRVTDDGKGIAPEDAETAFLRHATSKVKTAADLDEIFTLGFRGEALASICAVSKISMLTRQTGAEMGCNIELDGGEVISKQETGCPEGTTIIVKNLFYNTPARMKFLKKDVSEANAVASIVEKIALSNPGIAIKFIRDGKIDIQTVGDGKLISAVHSVLGKSFANTLLPVSHEKNGVKVEGFISKSNDSRGKRGMQHFFLNGRSIKNMTMTVALEESYKGAIMVGRFPACVLLVNISPAVVDVNVHPTKTEVRFSDDRVIYDAVYFACKNALMADSGEAEFVFNDKPQKHLEDLVKFKTITPEASQVEFEDKPISAVVTFEKDVNKSTFDKPSYIEKEDKLPPISMPAVPPPEILKKSKLVKNPFYLSQEEQEKILFKDMMDSIKEKGIGFVIKPLDQVNAEIEAREKKKGNNAQFENGTLPVPKVEQPNKPDVNKDRFNNSKIIGEVFGTYILLECESALYLVDKHAAHERLIYNTLSTKAEDIDKQFLLEPIIVKLSREEHELIMGHKTIVEDIGFVFEDFGGSSVIVRALPSYVPTSDAVSVITEIAGNFNIPTARIAPQMLDNMLHRIACRTAIKARDKNSEYELAFLIECLKEHGEVKHCPHGRPVTVKITRSEIERKFGRI